MDTGHTAAKVTIPSTAEDYPRERLFHLLDEGRSRPLIWVCGPGGAGKTHLLASYIKHRGLDAIWYHVDHYDTDIASFFYYMGLALRNYSSVPDADLPLLNLDHARDLARFTHRFFGEYIKISPIPKILVLDNLQEIHEGAPIYRVILEAATLLPAGTSIVGISRNSPPARFVLLRAEQKMAVMDWRDLRFTESEFSRAAGVLGNEHFSDEAVGHLHGQLEGWIAGLVLVMEQARHSRGGTVDLAGHTVSEIMDLFTTLIWENVKPDVRDFLLKTACFPFMTEGMARELTGMSSAEQILNYLSARNLFTLRIQPGPRYRYHNLFREFLLKQLSLRMPLEEIKVLKKNAAALLLQEGYPEESAELLLEEKDWEGLHSLVKQAAWPLYKQGRYQTVQGWIKRIPEPLQNMYPWFSYWQAVCDASLNFDRRLKLYERAFALFEKGNDPSGLLLSWAGKVMTYLHRQASLEELDRLIENFKELEPHFETIREPDIRRHIATSMYIAMTFRQPNHPDATIWERMVHDNQTDPKGIDSQASFLLAVALRKYYTGDVSGFTAAINEFRNGVDDLERLLPNTRALYLTLNAIERWLSFRLDECLEKAREGLKSSEETAGTIWDGLLLGQEINVWLSREDLAEARKSLELYRSWLERLPPLSVSYYHQRVAWYCLASKDFKEALTNAQEGHRYALMAGIPNNMGYAHIVAAEAHLALDDLEGSEKHLREASKVAKDLGNALMIFQCGLLEARLSQAMGEESEGEKNLSEALLTGRRHCILNWQFLTRETITKLLITALDRGHEAEYVSHLIRQWGIQPAGDLLNMERWPWPFKIYTLGRLEVLRNGVPLRFEGKVQQRPLELLKVIIALGGRGISSERLIETLWPDSAGDAGQRTLETNLLRLRRLLGSKEVVLLKSGRLTLNPNLCWVDHWAFERAFNSVGTILQERDCSLLNRAARIYRGAFLPNDDTQAWSVPARERLQNKYIRLVERCGTYREGTGDYEGAINYYLKAIELCPLAENLYRKLMLCYEKLGRKGEAIGTYRRCQRVFTAAYGIEPGKPIRDLHERLLS